MTAQESAAAGMSVAILDGVDLGVTIEKTTTVVSVLNGLDLRVAVEHATAAVGVSRLDCGLASTEESGFLGRMCCCCGDGLGRLLVLGPKERHCG